MECRTDLPKLYIPSVFPASAVTELSLGLWFYYKGLWDWPSYSNK